MGIKCIKPSECCNETNLSHQYNNIKEPLYQNEEKNEKIEESKNKKRI